MITLMGILGSALVVTAYAMLQLGRWTSDGLPFLWLTAAGSAMIIATHFWQFNPGALGTQIIILGFTLLGLMRKAK